MGEYTHGRPLRLFEICAGYGSQALALERLRRDYPDFGFELAGWCECDPESSKPIDEQPAVIAHNALHPDGIGKNLGDLTKIDWEQVPDFDLLTASTPCQSISSAGLQHGFVKDSGTRSSIIWNVHDCVRVKRPQYILMENVSAILSDKFFPLLHLWMVELERMGYTNFMPTSFTLQDGSTTRNGCLNSKHYGCQQNRERWFTVSILDCPRAYYFPQPFPLTRRLKDVLEQNVDERYYLKEEQVQKLVMNIDKKESKEPSVQILGDLQPDSQWQGSVRQQNQVVGIEGIAPACTAEHERHPYKIAEPQDNVMLGWTRSNTGKGDPTYHPVNVANCVTAAKRDNTQNYVLEKVIEEVRKAFPNRGILMYKGNPYFVRKLSTRELYRLMDLEETDIDTLMATDISKTSHSKLAGNSIVVSVLYHIFRTMFIDTVPIAGTQTTLF